MCVEVGGWIGGYNGTGCVCGGGGVRGMTII